MAQTLESTKWYLWHRNVERALDRIEDCVVICDDKSVRYKNRKKFMRHLEEFDTYIRNNRQLIPCRCYRSAMGASGYWSDTT